MPPDLLVFLEQFRDAFNRLDGEAVARLYAVPSGIAHDDRYTHWPTFEPIAANMHALCRLYRENGYRAAHFTVASFLPQGERFALADLAWTIEREAGLEPWTFNTSYNLMRTEAGWRVLLCTAYSEQKLQRESAA